MAGRGKPTRNSDYGWPSRLRWARGNSDASTAASILPAFEGARKRSASSDGRSLFRPVKRTQTNRLNRISPARPALRGLQNASRVHGTIERTTGMLGVRSATGRLRFIVSRSPATPFGARRVSAKNASSDLASCRSRKLGTAFRSPVTTLSPPLRGQRSCPAPSLPRQCFFAHPLDRKLLRSVRFRSRNRANSSPSTRCPRRSPALLQCHPVSTPLKVISHPPDQSVQPASPQQARLA